MNHATGGHTIAALAQRLGGEVVGRADLVIRGIAPLEDAGADEITFIVDNRWAAQWKDSRAGAAVVTRNVEVNDHDPARRALIRVDQAERAFVALMDVFTPRDEVQPPGVHPTAIIHPTVAIGEGAAIGPFVTIGAGSAIGRRVILHAGCHIERDCAIGDDCVLYQNVIIRRECILGRRVVLHSGVAIGTDGFGYVRHGNVQLKIPHSGNVVIEDDVEIGANSCVDRAKFGSTVIGPQSKIDNLVQIGHNVRIGRACVIAGMSGIAGSTVVGDRVEMGGQAGISDHITVGDDVRLAVRALVIDDVEAGEWMFGYPAQPYRKAMRDLILLGRLREWMKEVEERLKQLEEQ